MSWIQTSAPSANWISVASSTNGDKLVAVIQGGGIYTSTDSGLNWSNANNAPTSAIWTGVASSADGTKLVAVIANGAIYTSTDSGLAWSNANNAPTAVWFSVASSADGTKLVAAIQGGGIYTSSNSGLNWSNANNAPTTNWISVASSTNGDKLVAVSTVAVTGRIYTSINFGVTWSNANNAPITNWQSVASSTDGTKLVAAIQGGGIYTSTDSGLNWSNANNAPTSAIWTGVASSADGVKLVAVISNGAIYTSTDSGLAWSNANNAPSANWSGVASSADGFKLVAVIFGGGIYTLNTPASNICFPAGTPIQTDQGSIAIEKLNKTSHTIQGQPIVHITKTITLDKYLICFEPNALSRHVPNKRTVMSKDHKIDFQGQLVPAERFLNYSKAVKKVKYSGEVLYNVLLENYGTMQVNGLMCETLHPDNIMAKLYTNNYTDAERNTLIVQMNDSLAKRDFVKYTNVVNKLT